MEIDLWLKKYRIRSTAILAIAMGLLIWVTYWGTKFAETSRLSGLEIAGVLAAVQVPATMLFTSVYATYSRTKLP